MSHRFRLPANLSNIRLPDAASRRNALWALRLLP